MSKSNINSSPPSSSQSTSSNRSPFTPGTSFSPELKREDDKFKTASVLTGRGLGNAFHRESVSDNVTGSERNSGDDPFLGTALGSGITLTVTQAVARNTGHDQAKITKNDNHDLELLLSNLSLQSQSKLESTSSWQPIQDESTAVTRYPRHGKFTHETQMGDDGWVTRVLELTFNGDWNFKSCTENLRTVSFSSRLEFSPPLTVSPACSGT
jgi:hypothetical protein